MSTFTLAISCLTTSNLPRFMDLTFQVPMQYYSLQHWTLLPSPVTSTTGCCFALAPSLHSFQSYFSTDLQEQLGTYRPVDFIFQCPIFLPFLVVHGVLKARILKWFAICFSSDHILSKLSSLTCPSWMVSQGMDHSFIELDKAVSHVTRLVSFLWLWFSVCLPSDGEG